MKRIKKKRKMTKKKRKMTKKKKKMKRKKKEGGEANHRRKKKANKTVKINVLAKMTQKTKIRNCRSLGAWSADASGFQNTS